MKSKLRNLIGTNIGKITDRFGMLDYYLNIREKLFNSSAVILLYHRVDDSNKFPWAMPPKEIKEFEKQISYLSSRYNVISLNFLVRCINENKAIPRKAVVITFDDGFKDIYLNAYPILKKYGVKGTIFITTGRIGCRELHWRDKINYVFWHTTKDEVKIDSLGRISLKTLFERRQATSFIKSKLEALPRDERVVVIESLLNTLKVEIPSNLNKELMLSWAEVREMNENGIEIGAHTVSHPVLTKISLSEAKKEIKECKNQIEEKINTRITSFAYPYGNLGSYNEYIKKVVKESGYNCGVICSNSGLVTLDTNIYELNRISSGQNLEIFKLYVSRLYFDFKMKIHRIN